MATSPTGLLVSPIATAPAPILAPPGAATAAAAATAIAVAVVYFVVIVLWLILDGGGTAQAVSTPLLTIRVFSLVVACLQPGSGFRVGWLRVSYLGSRVKILGFRF
jgi:hypothetical protein